MKIAVLRWGSLIWDQGCLKLKSGWERGGPELPLEFSRISKSRCGSLTLVIDRDNGKILSTRYAISSHTDLDSAICNLACREGTKYKGIGYVNVLDGSKQSRFTDISDSICKWAKDNNFDAVIWTDLSTNYKKETTEDFSIDNAVEYLNNLSPSSTQAARDYICNAPPEIETPLRLRLKCDSWLNK